jgi:hypothetical protein
MRNRLPMSAPDVQATEPALREHNPVQESEPLNVLTCLISHRYESA